jgi:hypothetical protein
MVIPHSGQHGHETATPVLGNPSAAHVIFEIPPRSVWHKAAMAVVQELECLLDELEKECRRHRQEFNVPRIAQSVVRREGTTPNTDCAFPIDWPD